MCNTPVEVQFTSAGCLNYPCRTPETIEATVADSADDPEITLQKKSRTELVRHAMSNLSADHRAILDLVYYQEKSIEDCALILGIPAATVKTRMFYARKKLAELVQEP
jgi:RNA polymerase sigma-70 factor (ECF subfamily)